MLKPRIWTTPPNKRTFGFPGAAPFRGILGSEVPLNASFRGKFGARARNISNYCRKMFELSKTPHRKQWPLISKPSPI